MCRTLAACSLALPAACPGSRDLQDCGAVRRAGCFVLRAHP
ncbi:GTPase, partial [Pseudomonas aeruginosa]